MLCAIWYRMFNFKDVKNTHRGVLLLVKLQAIQMVPNCTVHYIYSGVFRTLSDVYDESFCENSEFIPSLHDILNVAITIF